MQLATKVLLVERCREPASAICVHTAAIGRTYRNSYGFPWNGQLDYGARDSRNRNHTDCANRAVLQPHH